MKLTVFVFLFICFLLSLSYLKNYLLDWRIRRKMDKKFGKNEWP